MDDLFDPEEMQRILGMSRDEKESFLREKWGEIHQTMQEMPAAELMGKTLKLTMTITDGLGKSGLAEIVPEIRALQALLLTSIGAQVEILEKLDPSSGEAQEKLNETRQALTDTLVRLLIGKPQAPAFFEATF